MWFTGVEVEQETSAPPPKKNPGSTPEMVQQNSHTNAVNKEKVQSVINRSNSCCQ